MRALPALILTLVPLVLAAPAQAGFVTFGSDLSKTPTIDHNKPNDAVYFNDALVGGSGVDVNVTGQVVKVEMKGRIIPSSQTLAGGGNPFNVVHFQVIKPAGGGAWTVPSDGGTSADYRMPWTGPDDQVNTWDTKTDALCVRPGFRLDFATLGGFDYDNGYNDGTPFRVFAAAPGARVLQYSAAGTEGVNNGQTFTPQDSRADEELLMRYVVATGTDARYACQDAETQQGGGGGGTTTPSTPKATGLTLPRKQKPRVALRWRLPIAGFCHATGTCRGTMTVTAKGKKIGTKKFAVGGHKSDGIKVTLNKLGRKLFKRSHKRLKVTITAVTAPGGTSNTDSMTVVITSRY